MNRWLIRKEFFEECLKEGLLLTFKSGFSMLLALFIRSTWPIMAIQAPDLGRSPASI